MDRSVKHQLLSNNIPGNFLEISMHIQTESINQCCTRNTLLFLIDFFSSFSTGNCLLLSYHIRKRYFEFLSFMCVSLSTCCHQILEQKESWCFAKDFLNMISLIKLAQSMGGTNNECAFVPCYEGSAAWALPQCRTSAIKQESLT